jgi:hypothetical protein
MMANKPEMDDRYRSKKKPTFSEMKEILEEKLEYEEMAEKIYMANMSGHQVNMQLASDIGEEYEED